MEKPIKKTIAAHTSRGRIPCGDFYGTGVKAKVGSVIRSSQMAGPIPRDKIKTPPKRVA